MPERCTTPRYPLSTPIAGNFVSVTEGSPLTPTDIDVAYSLFSSPTDGAGVSVAVINAFGSDRIKEDFLEFGRQFDLPYNSLEVYYPAGSTITANNSWNVEAHADTQWAYAAAPSARIICVFARDASVEALFSAVDFAIAQGADIISMSWGSDEFIGQAQYTERMKNSGRIFIASAGDVGGRVVFPSSSDAVVSVGGTVLHRTRNGRVFARSAWINGGGGPSRFTPIPFWQSRFEGISLMSGDFRATPDVALNASESPGYAVYIRDAGGIISVGGTSVGAPIFAGICARLLQKNSAALSGKTVMEYLYTLAGKTQYSKPQYAFNDITIGTNGVYDALIGYDMCTGLGAPIGRQIIG